MTSRAASSPEIGAAGFESGRTLHFPCFDAFRFFGMTMVLVVHATFATRPWVQEHLPSWLQAVLERMDIGVAVFFVISGFLLFRPFVAAPARGQAAAPRPHLPAAARAARHPRLLVRAHRVCRAPRPTARRREGRVPLLLRAVPVREPGRGVGRRARSRGRLRDPAGVEPHRRVRLLPDAAAARALAHPARCGQGADAADPPRACSCASASTSSARCSASTSSPPTRRGSASPPSGRRTGSTSSPSGWPWPRSARGSTPVVACRASCSSSAITRWCRGAPPRASASCAARSGRRSLPASTAPSTGSAGSCSACSPSSCSRRRCSATRRRGGPARCCRAARWCTSARSRSASTSSTSR